MNGKGVFFDIEKALFLCSKRENVLGYCFFNGNCEYKLEIRLQVETFEVQIGRCFTGALGMRKIAVKFFSIS